MDKRIWLWICGILVAAYYVFVAIDNQSNELASATDRTIGSLLLVTAAVLVLGGLALAQRQPVAAMPLVIIGALPSVAFYWTVVTPVLGIAVVCGVILEVLDVRRSSRAQELSDEAWLP